MPRTLFPLLLLALAGCASLPPRGEPHFLASSRREGGEAVAWTELDRYSFDDPAKLADWPVPEGTWAIRDGALCAVAGDANRAILLAHDRPGPLRIEFDARLEADAHGRLGDITVLLDATNDKRFFRGGYALTTGSYYNWCTTFYRLGRPLARTEFSPLVPGRTYHVAVERVGGHLRYWLDERILLDAWDATPLTPAPTRWIGLRTWATDLRIDNLVISTAAP